MSIADDYWYFPCDDLVLVMIGGQAVEPDHGMVDTEQYRQYEDLKMTNIERPDLT